MRASERPTLVDARRAADALVADGAERVMLFGSLARGEPDWRSDIDLVAVFDDMDYRRRWSLEDRLRQKAWEACGHPVDVIATDRAEWRIQTERVSKSFASAIFDDLVVLAECEVAAGARDPAGAAGADQGEGCGARRAEGDRASLAAERVVSAENGRVGDPTAEKDQVMATSNAELAAIRMRDAAELVIRLQGQLTPSQAERDAEEADNMARHLLLFSQRLIGACSTAHLVVENSLKAVGTLTDIKANLLWDHDVGKLADAIGDVLPVDEAEAIRELLRSAPEVIRVPGYISMWRTRGAYSSPTEGRTAAEIATPEFTHAIATIACDTAEAAAHWLTGHGTASEAVSFALTQIRELRAELEGGDGA